MTREEARQEVENKKDAYTDSLKSFAKACQEKTDNAVLFGAVVEAHTRLLNTISNTITELHNEYNFFEDKNLCQEIEATVKNFLESSFNYCDLMDTVANKYKQQPVLPSEFAYNTIQTFLNTFSSPEYIQEQKGKFEAKHISTYGFNSKMQPPMDDVNKAKQRWISIIVGAVSVAVVILILLFKENISEAFSIYLRILFALGCGGISAALIGTFTIDMQQTRGITAAGGFAVFVLIYFFNPVTTDDFSTSIYLRNKANNEIIDGSGLTLQLRLDENLKPGEYLPTSKNFEFRPIPSAYSGKKVELILNNESKWVFLDSSRSTTLQLAKGGIDVNVILDTVR